MSTELAKFEFFSDLSDEERAQLADFVEERSFAAGRRLFGKGEEAEELLFVIEGHVRFEDEPAGGTFGPGAVLGSFALSSVRKRAVSAEAQDDVKLLSLSRESYWRLRSDYPNLALSLQEGLLSRLADDLEEFLSN